MPNQAFGGSLRGARASTFTSPIVGRFHGRAPRSVSIPGVPGAARHRLRVYEYTRRGLARRLTRTVWGCERGR